MSWYYRTRRRKLNGKWFYDVVEYFKPKSWTKDSIAPCGDTKKELIKCLEMMLDDVKKIRTLTDKEE